MDATTQASLMPMIVLAVGLFAAGMYYYRRFTAGESFDLGKFLQTLGLGALGAFVAYAASASIPDVNTVITQIEALAPGGTISSSAILAALLAVWNWFTKSYSSSSSGTTTNTAATQAATTEQAKSSLATTGTDSTYTVTGTTPAYAAGKGTVLGIYKGSAEGNLPVASLAIDINDLSTLFAEMQALVTGKVVYSVLIDGNPLKDVTDEGLDMKAVGTKYPLPFYLPSKLRTAGNHIVTVRTGHLEGQQSISDVYDSKIVYDGAAEFSLIITGTRKE